MFTVMKQSFSDINQVLNQCLLQKADSMFMITSENAEDCFDLSYQQIWLYAMRHFHEMSVKHKKKKKNLLIKSRTKRANETVLCEFVALVNQLKFESDKISALKQ